MEPVYIALKTVDSTMSFAKQAVLSGDISTDTIITAEQQLSGKGRWGRMWNSPAGNLYYTRVFPEYSHISPTQYSHIGALAALATIHATGCLQAVLKWPNDILYQGEKLSGILIERFFYKNTPWISTGIGMNVQDEGLEELRATSLSHILQKNLSVPQIAYSLGTWHTLWLNTEKKRIQEAWHTSIAWMKGRPLTTHKGTKTISGIVDDFLEDGSLILLLPDGTREHLLSHTSPIEL